jgi:cell division protein FtsB|tara:strand:- start:6348 stop:6833 length:486 start_codon:yes stop_codon:yes gene_type:complete
MFGSIKIAMIVIMLAGAGGGFMYVKNLKADLATSEANNAKLEQSVESQKAVITQMKADFKAITEINEKIEKQNKLLKAEFAALDKKFNKINGKGEVRDVGDLATKRPSSVEKIINKGTQNAMRCQEIAMGSPLTEKEKNATKKSEINSECPSIANPNYVPY